MLISRPHSALTHVRELSKAELAFLDSLPVALPRHVAEALWQLTTASGELGLFTAQEAYAAGLSIDGVQRLVRIGVLWRVEQGWYALALPGLTPEEVHRRRVFALVSGRLGDVVASHHSALAWHGLATFRADFATVHLTYRHRTTHRRRPGCVSHGSNASTVGLPADAWAVAPAFAVVQAGLLAGELGALVAGDAALASGAATVADLQAAAEASAHTRGIKSVAAVLPYLDRGAESALESLLRYALALLGYATVPQYLVKWEGRVARVDLKLRGTRLIAEADGAVKYRPKRDDDGRPAKRIVDIVSDQQARQTLLERAGFKVLRFAWGDVVDERGRLRLAHIKARVEGALRAG